MSLHSNPRQCQAPAWWLLVNCKEKERERERESPVSSLFALCTVPWGARRHTIKPVKKKGQAYQHYLSPWRPCQCFATAAAEPAAAAAAWVAACILPSRRRCEWVTCMSVVRGWRCRVAWRGGKLIVLRAACYGWYRAARGTHEYVSIGCDAVALSDFLVQLRMRNKSQGSRLKEFPPFGIVGNSQQQLVVRVASYWVLLGWG